MSIDFSKKSGIFWIFLLFFLIFCCIMTNFMLSLTYQIAQVVSC